MMDGVKLRHNTSSHLLCISPVLDGAHADNIWA